MEKRIKAFENILKEKDNIIFMLEKERKEYLTKIKDLEIKNINMFFELNEQLIQKEELIKEYKLIISQIPFGFLPGEKLMSIIFISPDKNIISSFICKNTDTFAFIENKFYEKFPQYKGLDNTFILNGRYINRYKSLDENKIKNDDIITISNEKNKFL